MKLYFNPKSREVIAKWILDECGADYEIVSVDFAKRKHKTPEFLKINPAGKRPALVDGDSKIIEGAAICLYVGELEAYVDRLLARPETRKIGG